jgi:SAM-dependent methyltransferase
VPPGAHVLDAGCGTGRVAIRLAELGYDCVGVDLDPAMLAEARRAAPALAWVPADLASLALDRRFDLVVAAWPRSTGGAPTPGWSWWNGSRPGTPSRTTTAGTR